MIAILKELKALMKKRRLSPGDVAKYIGCSQGTAYNWLVYERSSPGPIYQERIRKAIRRIERELSRDSISIEINRYYQALWPHLTHEEKDQILEIIGSPGKDSKVKYLRKLKALAKSHEIEVDLKGDSDGL